MVVKDFWGFADRNLLLQKCAKNTFYRPFTEKLNKPKHRIDPRPLIFCTKFGLCVRGLANQRGFRTTDALSSCPVRIASVTEQAGCAVQHSSSCLRIRSDAHAEALGRVARKWHVEGDARGCACPWPPPTWAGASLPSSAWLYLHPW